MSPNYIFLWHNRPKISSVSGKAPGIGLNERPIITDANHDPWHMKARPLKGYRKQYTNLHGKVSLNQFEVPGGYIYNTQCNGANSDGSLKDGICISGTCGINGVQIFNNKIENKDCKIKKCESSSLADKNSTPQQIARNRTRSMVSNNKNYSYSTKEYLQRKCKTYNQKQSLGRDLSSHNLNGTTNAWTMTTCFGQTCCDSSCTNITYYQPIGATSSSNNTNKRSIEPTECCISGCKSPNVVVNGKCVSVPCAGYKDCYTNQSNRMYNRRFKMFH